MKLSRCPECGSYVLKLKFCAGKQKKLALIKVSCVCGWSKGCFNSYDGMIQALSTKEDE